MRASGDLGAGADLDVPDQARLAAHDHEIPELRRAGDADLADDHAMPAHHDVVPDLHEIINFRAFADHGVLERAAVDAAVGADLHVVLDDDAADLRHLDVTLGAHGEAETVLPHPHAGVENDPVAHEGMDDGGAGAHIRAAADRDPVADERACSNGGAAPDLRFPPDHRAGLDGHTLLQPRA